MGFTGFHSAIMQLPDSVCISSFKPAVCTAFEKKWLDVAYRVHHPVSFSFTTSFTVKFCFSLRKFYEVVFKNALVCRPILFRHLLSMKKRKQN